MTAQAGGGPEGAGRSAGPRVLALDLGSSSVRAAIYDEEANPVPNARARRRIDPDQDESGRAELDPRAYVDKLVECLDELSGAGALEGVDRVATSSQWHSVMAVEPAPGTDHEATLRPRSGVLTWLDTRAHGHGGVPEDATAFHERTGSWVHPLYWSAKVPFLRSYLDLPSTTRFVGLPDYVRAVLLGTHATSLSLASGTGLLDLRRGTWDTEALELAELDVSDVPPIDDTPQRLAPAWRARWPALAEAHWYPVLGDGAASNLGSGCGWSPGQTDQSDRAVGRVAVTVGTSAALRVVHGPDVPPPPATVWRYRVDAERLVSGIAFSGGGVLHAWATRAFRLPADAEPTCRPGTSGLLSIPLHAGSRPPGTAPAGSGLIVGLSLDTSPDELLAATLEGVALEVARALEVLETSFRTRLEVVVGGGAVHASAWWRAALAATLGRPLRLADDPEVGARGAAALALRRELPPPQARVEPTVEDVERMVVVRKRYAALRAVFDEQLVGRFRDPTVPPRKLQHP